MNKLIPLLLISFLALFTYGCYYDENPSANNTNGNPRGNGQDNGSQDQTPCSYGKTNTQNGNQLSLGENTIIITSEEAALLVFSDQTTLIFKGGSNSINNVAPGNILVSGVTPNTPSGFLRQVETVTKTANEYRFTTIHAKLDNAIEHAHIEYHQKLDESERDGFYWDISKIIADHDNDSTTVNDNFSFNGKIEGDINMGLTIDTDTRLFRYDFGFDGKINGKFKAGESLGALGLEAEVIQVKLAPKTVFLLGFPFVFTPVINVVVGIKGEINADFTIDVNYDLNADGYLQTECGEWVQDGNATVTGTHDFQGSYTSNAKVYSGPELQVRLYDWSGATATVGIYASTEYQYNSLSNDWTIHHGISGEAKAEIELFSWFNLLYSPAPLFQYSTLAASGTCPTFASRSNRMGNLVTISPIGGNPPYKYSKDGLVFGPNPSFGNSPNGWNAFYVRENNGCETMKKVWIP